MKIVVQEDCHYYQQIGWIDAVAAAVETMCFVNYLGTKQFYGTPLLHAGMERHSGEKNP